MSMEHLAPRLAALGNITRLEIYRTLVRAGRSGLLVSGVQERLQIPASTLSHHLHKLVEVGLVTQRRQGTSLICQADFALMQTSFALFTEECCADEQAAQTCKTDDNTCC